jgi:hypothetical protein
VHDIVLQLHQLGLRRLAPGERLLNRFGQDGGDTVQLVSSAAGVATIAYDGQQGSCSSGETIELGSASVECTEVGDGSVDLIIIR